MRAALFAVLLVVAFVVVFRLGQANAWSKEPTLSTVASIVAMRPVGVRCFDLAESESPGSYGAWGYVRKPIGRARYAAVEGILCDAALRVNDPAVSETHRALGVLVVVHEGYHLRRWGGAGDEGKVECKAIRHWKVIARMLGASEAAIAELWPTALALHAEQTRIFDVGTGTYPYDEPGCAVPPLESP